MGSGGRELLADHAAGWREFHLFRLTDAGQPATFGINLWTEHQKLSDDGLRAYQRATYGINIKQSYPQDKPLGLIPAMSFGGITGAASVTYHGRFPMVDDSMMFSFSDSLTKVWRSHEFKFGFLMQRVQYNQVSPGGREQLPQAHAEPLRPFTR